MQTGHASILRTLFLIAAMFGPRFFFRFLVLFCAFCALAFYAITR